MPKKADIVWSQVTPELNASNPTNPRVTCNHCGFRWTSNSASRVRQHLQKCPSLPIDLYAEYAPQRQIPRDQSVPISPVTDGLPTRKRPRLDSWFDHINPNETEQLHILLAEWIYSAGLPLSTVYQDLLAS
jgi:hypothetical protein